MARREPSSSFIGRNSLTEAYLLKLEPNCHWWLQVSKDQLKLWINDKDFDFDLQHYIYGHHYENENEEQYVEFHVDANKFVHQLASRRYEFGGTTNIRVKDEEFWPIIIFGQDE